MFVQSSAVITLRSAVPPDVYNTKRRQAAISVHIQPVQRSCSSQRAHADLELRVVFVPDGSVRSTEDC